MKIKICTILIIFISFLACNLNNQKENDIRQMNLNGKIKSITENSYYAVEKFGEIVKGEKKINFLNKENHYLLFNENGYLVEEKNDLVVYKAINKYNENNQLIENKTYSEEGDLTGKTINLYNNEGNLIESNQYYEDKLIHKGKFNYNDNIREINYYDEKGKLDLKQKNIYKNKKLIENRSYDSDGNLTFLTKYIYDHSGNETEMISYNSLGNINQKIVSKYNNDNLIIESTDLYNDNETTKKYDYKLDSNKNWIQKIVFEFGRPDLIIERVIEYY